MIMGFEIFLAALIGTTLAGLWDLKTTEVPDDLPFVMIFVGIGFWVVQAASGNAYPLFISLVVGTALLAAGMLLYKKGQWGGADAWILAAVGYMIPTLGSGIFIVSYLINFFIVSAIYMIVYAMILGIMNPKIWKHFSKDVSKNKRVFVIPLLFLVFLIAMHFYASLYGVFVNPAQSALLFILVLFLTLFWRYGKVVEGKLFRKRIPASKLREGDVLVEMNWIGLTKKDVLKIRKRKKYVTIKEGIRFVPVFAITLAVTYLWGNLLFLLV